MILEFKKLNPDAKTPSYAHSGDACFDLNSIEEKSLSSMEKYLFKTGIAMAIPEGHVGLIKDRSGLAAKFGIHVLGGVIDSGYRGEISVVLINLGQHSYAIKKHDRIAQMLIQPVIPAHFQETHTLPQSSRGRDGFGSTGK